ncbi:MAG: type II secretion system F family protein [Pirellulaceae bacterium]
MPTRTAPIAKPGFFANLMRELTADRSRPNKKRLPARDLANMFNMLCTLLENGMPLQKALSALSNDASLRKHSKLLKRLNNRLIEGTSFHVALSAYPLAFPATVIQQIKIGESSGNLASSLRRVSTQVEGWLAIRNNLFQKLSYPALVIFAGSGLMVFMLTVVVPQFENVYAESQVDLPWVTSVVTGLSRALGRRAWLLLLPIFIVLGLFIRIRTSASAHHVFDRMLTRVPLIGSFVRDISVLQFLRSVHALSEAGFVPIDAISQACFTVTNRHVRRELDRLSSLLVSGTKLSTAMNDLEHLIPSSVRQLIMVGEHSGNITKACEGACAFIQNRLTRRINGAMACIEPILTIGLATCIGWIVLAMYMPMFKMFDVLDF